MPQIAKNKRDVSYSIIREVPDEQRESIWGSLTIDERNVLELTFLGFSNSEIAGELTYSESAIRKIMTSILAKLGVNNREQAAAVAAMWRWF